MNLNQKFMAEERLKIEYVPIGILKPNEYNPKRMTEKEAVDLEKSISEFGIVDPLIVNKAKGREGVIIGGHQRFKIYQKLKFKEVPVVWLTISDLNKEQELCLRLSKNIGSWDYDLLANFDEELLKEVGFENEELMVVFGLNEIDDFEIDFERYNILMVNPPGGVRLKERVLLNCKSKRNYDLIKKWVEDNGDDKLIEKILSLIKK